MDDPNNLSNFEQLLKKNTSKPSPLYRTNNLNKTTIKPQDVLHSVYSQIKLMQQADIRSPCVGKTVNKAKSTFLAVNKLPLYNEAPKPMNNFDTQCVSDTQLINIIEDAEALIDTHKGITQEFDTAFTHTNVDHRQSAIPLTQVKLARDNQPNIEEFETTFTQTNVDRTVSFLEDKIEMEGNNPCGDIDQTHTDVKEAVRDVNGMKDVNTLKEMCDIVLEANQSVVKTVDIDETSIETNKQIESNIKINENNENVNKINLADNTIMVCDSMNIGDSKERSPSPILKTKSKTVPPPLIVPLDTFERFERLAIPLIDSNKDFATCKHLINSQILGGELCINTDDDNIFNENIQLSPIIKENFEVIQDNTKDFKPDVIDLIINSRDKRNDSLKDEILFSSDEENDFIYREFHNMPLTQELDTSFDKHSDVLDETMYVCFQTASNKSIKISADSLQKANGILNEDNKNGKDFSLAELVEICDEKSINDSTASFKVQVKANIESKPVENKVSTDSNMTQTNLDENHSKDEEMIEDDQIKIPTAIDYDDTAKKPPEKQCFVGFKTASNKKIALADKALDHGKMVFKDIDFDLLEQNSDTIVEETKDASDNKIEDSCNKNDSEIDVDDKINDDMLIQEFENIEMSLEEKEKSLDGNNSDFQGLKTASNKNIDISDAVKAKIKDVFKDIDLGEINDKSEDFYPINKNYAANQPVHIQNETVNKEDNSEAAFVGFKTASNKNIEISAKALADTKKVFEDIGRDIKKSRNSEQKDKNLDVNSSQPSNQSTGQVFLGFKTASNQDIKISEVALSKSNEIFKDIDKESSKDVESEVEMANTLFGLKTESNKNINISKQVVQKNKSIFKDMKDNNEKTEDIANISKENASFSGFKTANNKTVVISEESIAKSKKLFENLEDKVTSNTNDNQPIANEPKDHIPTFKGFQTASKKPVSVSAVAIERSKKIFQDIDNNDTLNKNIAPESKGFQTCNKEVAITKEAKDASKKLLDQFKKDNQTSFVGFKTASNRNVKISEQALAKCNKIFNDIDDLPSETIENEKITFQAFGFQTANNRQVEVSKNALEITKNLFKDVETPGISEMGSFKGFQTASKQKVVVSKEAIEKSKALFNDIDEAEVKESFIGFKTANKKKVEVSKDAMKHAKGLFNDIKDPDIKEKSFKGFQTASKKKVNVSEDALAKTKQIFKDIDSKLNEDIDSNRREENQNNMGIFSFQTGNNNYIKVSEDSLKKSKKLLKDDGTSKSTDDNLNKKKILNENELNVDNTVNLDNIINTQVMNNFEESLYTEDFKQTPKNNKRSGSPILSCPRAKKRKRFETPYRDEKSKKAEYVKIADDTVNTSCGTKIKFTDNYKKNKIYKLKDLSSFGNSDNIDPYITNFNLENLLDFEFVGRRNEVTDTKMSINDLKKQFLNAVNTNLVPEGWLDNHLKLILWKLLSYEVKLYKIVCTVQNIIDQLKYRYDKELYNAERSALRKIYERDDVPSKTMVLCVAGIYIDGVSVNSVANTKDVELLLTDGWYFIKASIDKMLSKLVYDRRIIIGCKIVTCGAELTNCEGMSPWEDTSAVRLKIFGNSTRPAPWDAILGYSRAAILNQLSTVKVDGGKICRLKACVTRVYPLLYVEKFEDGSTVTRSERLEHLHQIKYEAERELMMERIYEEVQKEFSDQESQDSEVQDSGKRKCYDSGSQIAKMMKISKDPMEFRAQLTSSQVHLLKEHTCNYRDKMLEAIQSKIQEKISRRNVVTLARGRIASLNNKMEITKGMLSIWKPNDAILELFREGSWIEVMNTVPTAIRFSEIQITAGRQSIFRQIKCKTEVTPLLQSLKRKCFKISDVTQNPTMTTDYNEIDTAGIVFLIEPSNREFESSRNFQNVYLADTDKNIMSVNFWGGLKKFGFENILDTGQVVACANLQKRAGNTGKNIPQFRVTEFTYFTKTPRNVQAREIVDELDKKLFGLDRRKFCEDCIAIKNNYTAIRCLNNTENETPYRYYKSDYSFARNKMFIDTPVNVKSNKMEDLNFNLTGLDFESSFKQDTTELSPRTLLRKKKVGEKIAKLKLYGEPPPLSPINIINKSENAKSSYKSPLISSDFSAATTNIPNGATISNKLPDESPKTIPREGREKSPVISMKRGFVRSVPVKLNFANDDNDSVDHFAEEFDGSPPLSLD